MQVTLGQKTQQSVQVASRCLWDQAVDNYASVTYATQSVFAVAQCYGVYYEWRGLQRSRDIHTPRRRSLRFAELQSQLSSTDSQKGQSVLTARNVFL